MVPHPKTDISTLYHPLTQPHPKRSLTAFLLHAHHSARRNDTLKRTGALCDGRIRRNRRPDYVYVDPVTLQNYDEPYQVHRHRHHVRELDYMGLRQVHSILQRAQAPNTDEYHVPTSMNVHNRSINGAGRYFAGSSSHAHAQLTYAKEDITPGNVQLVDIVQILRCRARALSATVKRMKECNENKKPERFEFSSPEKAEDCIWQRELSLCQYISTKVQDM